MTVDTAIITCLRNEARSAAGEVCGVLIGDRETIRSARPLVNHSRRADRFFITAADVRRAEEEAESDRLQLVGFYHSHVSDSARPSRYDLEHALPGYIYVIVGPGGEVRAWRLRDDRTGFSEVELTS